MHDRIFGDFPAKNTVYTPYIYGPGQPYIYGEYTPFWPALTVSHMSRVCLMYALPNIEAAYLNFSKSAALPLHCRPSNAAGQRVG